MNPRFYHKIPADFLTGKAILILIVTLCSAFSFLLGYFVGRTGVEVNPAPLSMNAPLSAQKDHEGAYQQKDELSSTPDTKGRISNDRSPAAVAPLIAGEEPAGAVKEKEFKKGNVKITSRNKKAGVRRENSAYYYTIQVGAFRGRQQAGRLKDRLRKKGYSVKVISAEGKRPLYRVWVGRFKSRKSAETAAIKLTRAEKVKTLVLKTDR